MKPALVDRLASLAIAYAKHRKALRENGQAIRELHGEADDYIDLKPYRERYLSGDVHDLPQGGCIVWHGWLHAVDTCQEWDGVQWPEDDDCAFRSMAMLLDQRKDIKAAGSKVRNSLRIIGDQLLRSVP